MIIFLDEQMVGASDSAVGYPNLCGCVGVTAVLSNGWMVGAHSSEAAEAEDLCGKIWDCIKMINGQPSVAKKGVVDWLCLTGNLTRHPGGDAKVIYKNKFENSASKDEKALPGALQVRLLDTDPLLKKGERTGIFVLVTHRGPGQMPFMQYKREKKVEYFTEELAKGQCGQFNQNGFWYFINKKIPFVKAGAIRKGKAPPSKGSLTIPVFHGA